VIRVCHTRTNLPFPHPVKSQDGQTIASASYDKTVKLWNRNGQVLQTLQGHSPVLGVAFSPDGQTIASATDDRTVKLWNLNLD
jgi:WD40 repeat protein